MAENVQIAALRLLDISASTLYFKNGLLTERKFPVNLEFWRGLLPELFPREGPGVQSRICPPYPQRVLKGD